MKNIILFFSIFLILCDSLLADDETGLRLSIINLISTPERFHNKLVMISGYAEIELENTVICFSEKPLSSRDCLWIDTGEDVFDYGTNEESLKKQAELDEYWEKFHQKKISIRGFFDMENTGHFGSSSGEITNIREVYESTSQGFIRSSPPKYK